MKDCRKGKLAFIIPYFVGGGKLPEFFECFLHTAKHNQNYTWIMFTDCSIAYDYPSNVIVHPWIFKNIKDYIQSKFDFQISLNEPKKLCDFKPAYGFIFSEFLEDYDYWGYCDIDEFYGDLSKWLSDEQLKTYDRLFQLGHMSIYRNNQQMSTLFMRNLKETEGKTITSYKQIFESDKHYAFDEWPSDCVNINHLCEESGVSICWDWPLSDIGPFCSSFKESVYSRKIHNWVDNSNSPSCIIVFAKGKLFLYWEQDGRLCSKEILYAHLQKRRLDMSKFDSSLDYFAIVPNRIISSDTMFTEKQIIAFLERNKVRQFFMIDENKHKFDSSTKWIKYQIKKRIEKYI